jgi:malonyl CoA-acyl carrier protein transacylase
VLQVTAPVLFDACARRVRESVAPSSIVELGPGRVLTGLVDTIYRQCADASAASEAALTGAAKHESDAAKHARAAANKAAAHDRSPHDHAVATAASRATIGTADELTAFVKQFGS